MIYQNNKAPSGSSLHWERKLTTADGDWLSMWTRKRVLYTLALIVLGGLVLFLNFDGVFVSLLATLVWAVTVGVLSALHIQFTRLRRQSDFVRQAQAAVGDPDGVSQRF